MGEYKTPGVYIKEKNAFPNSVVEAETAIPAFIGITEKAENGDDSLMGKPWKITSMTEFNKYFGGTPSPEFEISLEDAAATDPASILYQAKGKEKFLQVKKPAQQHTLFYHIVMFFANGGGTCYIVSIGNYKDENGTPTKIDDKNDATGNLKAVDALSALEKVQEITMVVVPEAVNSPEWKSIQTQMLAHCGKMMNRFAIFDVQPKEKENEIMDEQIEKFQEGIGANFLSYGAVYYPWLNTAVLTDNEMSIEMFKWAASDTAYTFNDFMAPDSKLLPYANECIKRIQTGKKTTKGEDGTPTDADATDDEKAQAAKDLHNTFLTNWSVYQTLVKKAKDYLNLLPPSAAMAGIYTMVDNTRGVWKAPANVSVNYVNSPTETINDAMQAGLNVPMNGKAVNVIRTFAGEGIKVWGARTLDGNSQDWRYVNVRRTMLFLEESVKNAARAYVFEPNDASTWINMKCMIENFLRSVWKRGGLAGATPEDAYEVHVGLGDTMTGDDILEGILRITVLVAISRPAEFIEITFQQQMQKS